jgi:hypothetical protein
VDLWKSSEICVKVISLVGGREILEKRGNPDFDCFSFPKKREIGFSLILCLSSLNCFN